MADKFPCDSCGNLILPLTAERYNGMCVPCAKGYRKNIEAAKAYNARERKLDKTDPSRLLWKKLHDIVYGNGEGNLGNLSTEQRTYWAVSLMILDVFNGGFEQYFTNSSSGDYETAASGLELIGATKSLNLLLRAKTLLFGETDVPKSQPDRWALMNTNVDRELDELDALFYEDADQIDEQLHKYAQRKRLFDDA